MPYDIFIVYIATKIKTKSHKPADSGKNISAFYEFFNRKKILLMAKASEHASTWN